VPAVFVTVTVQLTRVPAFTCSPAVSSNAPVVMTATRPSSEVRSSESFSSRLAVEPAGVRPLAWKVSKVKPWTMSLRVTVE
jgi:hypothetical protein